MDVSSPLVLHHRRGLDFYQQVGVDQAAGFQHTGDRPDILEELAVYAAVFFHRMILCHFEHDILILLCPYLSFPHTPEKC